MEHIPAEKLQEIKQKMLDEKERLEKELQSIAKKAEGDDASYEPEYEDVGSGEGDNALEVTDFGQRVALEGVLEKSLRDVIKSLNRIEAGDYGICNYCKKGIPVERLLARPESGSCVDCKSALQKNG